MVGHPGSFLIEHLSRSLLWDPEVCQSVGMDFMKMRSIVKTIVEEGIGEVDGNDTIVSINAGYD